MAWAYCGQALFVFVLGLALFWFWDHPARSRRHVAPARVVLVALLLFACWLPWMVFHYPGTMRDDTLPQLFQWYGIKDYYTQHPVTDTLLFGLFFSLGDVLGSREMGLFIYLVVQGAAIAAVVALALCYARSLGAPLSLLVLCFALLAFSRAAYQPVDAMSKDALNVPFFLLCGLCLAEIVRTRGASLRKAWFCAGFGVAVVLCIVTKRTMLYVLCLAFVATFVLLALRKAAPLRFAVAALVPVAVALFVWTPVVNRAVGAESNATYEMYSVPAQCMVKAVKDHPDALSAPQRRNLEAFIDVDRAVAVYNPWRSDEVTWCIRDAGKFGSCLGLLVELGVSYPLSYVNACMCLAGTWFSLDASISYGHDSSVELFDEGHLANWETFFASDEQMEVFFSTLDLSHPQELASGAEALEQFDQNQSTVFAFSSYGLFCTLLPLLALVYALTTGGVRAELLCLVVLPLGLMLSLLVGPLALYWYTAPAVFYVPVLAGLPYAAREAREEGSDFQEPARRLRGRHFAVRS